MKLAHISDLHIGIHMNGRRMLEDQEYILQEIIKIIKEEEVDGLLICGDVYDRPVPPEEGVNILSKFLDEVNDLGINIYMTSGNHDSPERLEFGSKLLEKAGVYVASKYERMVKCIRKEDEYGPINIYMLPFIKPSIINSYTEDKIASTDYQEAVKRALEPLEVNNEERNIILVHQMLTGAKKMESEEIIVGFVDAISVDLFERFDYVALGHLHKAQEIKRPTARYCGTPLKYSFSERNNDKSVTIIDYKEKGNIEISTVPLHPLKELRQIEGYFKDILENSSEDYVKIILKDEEQIHMAFNELVKKYPNLLAMEYESIKSSAGVIKASTIADNLSPLEVFETFYKEQKHTEIDGASKKYMERLIGDIL